MAGICLDYKWPFRIVVNRPCKGIRITQCFSYGLKRGLALLRPLIHDILLLQSTKRRTQDGKAFDEAPEVGAETQEAPQPVEVLGRRLLLHRPSFFGIRCNTFPRNKDPNIDKLFPEELRLLILERDPFSSCQQEHTLKCSQVLLKPSSCKCDNVIQIGDAFTP